MMDEWKKLRMYKRKLLPLFLGLVLSGTVVAQEYATFSVLDRSITEFVQDNETVVEFFLFTVLPVSHFLRDTVLTRR